MTSLRLTAWYVRGGGALALALALTGMLYMSSQLETSSFSWWLLPILLALVWGLWEALAALTAALDRRYPWARRPGARAAWQVLGGAALTLLLTLAPYSLFKWYSVTHWERADSRYSLSIAAYVGGSALLLGAFVSALHLGLRFLESWQAAELTRERLLRESAQARLAALNGHLNPHFIFNSLNVLGAMLDEHQVAPRAFIEHFAGLYRYILAVKDQEAVPLADELAGVAPYGFIVAQRFARALHVELPDPATLDRRWHLPPLCVQMLLENAIKHNAMSEQAPLRVRVWLDATAAGSCLVVENNCQPRARPRLPGRAGTGLANIRQRYHYLSDQPVRVEHSATTFAVRLPLLTLDAL